MRKRRKEGGKTKGRVNREEKNDRREEIARK